ncbi:MAG: hypothetical protein IPN19_02350 [Elusimicrobia bacterium]|nr:hypothetical protein [Elusimicrobiota bacterium]
MDTEYVVRMSANSDFQSSFAPVEYEAGIHSATFTALTANTTYWVRAWGKNRAEVLTEGYVSWEPQATDAGAPVLGSDGVHVVYGFWDGDVGCGRQSGRDAL